MLPLTVSPWFVWELGEEQFRLIAAVEHPADIIDAVVSQAVAPDVGRRQRLVLPLPILLEEAGLCVSCIRQVVDGAIYGVILVGDNVTLLGIHLSDQQHGFCHQKQ